MQRFGRTRIFVVLFFILSVAASGGYYLNKYLHTDKTFPVISMDQESVTVSLDGGDAAILEGVTARDAKDGDLTEKVFIESRSRFVNKGQFHVTCAVADSENHVTRATREVTYTDYKSPTFELTKPLKFQTARETNEDVDIAADLSAYDVLEGDISDKIRISGDYAISNKDTGDYPMEFSVANRMGDTVFLPVTVTVYSATEEILRPRITLSNYIVNTTVGQEVDPIGQVREVSYRGFTYQPAEDGNFYSGEYDANGMPVMFTRDSLAISANIDYNAPGVYEVKMTYTDAQDGISNYAYLYIVVSE